MYHFRSRCATVHILAPCPTFALKRGTRVPLSKRHTLTKFQSNWRRFRFFMAPKPFFLAMTHVEVGALFATYLRAVLAAGLETLDTGAPSQRSHAHEISIQLATISIFHSRKTKNSKAMTHVKSVAPCARPPVSNRIHGALPNFTHARLAGMSRCLSLSPVRTVMHCHVLACRVRLSCTPCRAHFEPCCHRCKQVTSERREKFREPS